MSEFTKGQRGVDLVEQEKWDEAIEVLSSAIKAVRSPPWLLARAQAYQRKGELDKALIDCEHAYLATLARQSPKRDQQLIDAQYRRGVLLFKKRRFADADACCYWAMRIALGHPIREEDTVPANVDENGDYKATVRDAEREKPQDQSGEGGSLEKATKNSHWVRIYSFRCMALGEMAKLPKGDPGRKITVSRVPNPPDLVHDDVGSAKKAQKASAADAAKPAAGAPTANAATAAAKEHALRFSSYQTTDSITISLFIKGANKDLVKVVFVNGKTVIIQNVPRTSNPNVVFSLNPEVNVEKSDLRVTGSIIEVKLYKAQPGSKVTVEEDTQADAEKLLGQAQESLATTKSDAKDRDVTNAASTTQAPGNGPPAYPTSSKSGPKDWERIGRDEDAAEGKDPGGDVEEFFKSIYSNASPEAQRAMKKSFLESNGTALSTDWSDVKDRTVETHPPDGAEAKKWT